MTEEDIEFDRMIQEVGFVFGKLNEKELQLISPLVDDIINQHLRDVFQIEDLLDRLFELVLFETGKDVYHRLLDYLATFNPLRAYEIQEHDNELLGKYDHIVEEAKSLAQTILQDKRIKQE